jgi:hypothetical protein
MARLNILNNLFKLHVSEKSPRKGVGDSNNTTSMKALLSGALIREGFMIKKSRKSDDKVYGILTSEYFAYGKEEFHVTGPSTMEMHRMLPLTMTLIT